MAGVIMDYSGLCLCCPSNFEAMEDQGLSYEEDADYLSFPRECKYLLMYLNSFDTIGFFATPSPPGSYLG